MTPARRHWVAVVSGLLAAGCGWFGGPDVPAPPDGFRRASTGVVAFAYPDDWRPAPDGDYPAGWTAAYEGRAGGETVAQVAVFERLPDTTDPYLAAEAAITGVEQNAEDMRRLGQHEVDVPGATGAVRVDYAYGAVAGGRLTGETIRGSDVTVVDEAGRAATVRITRIEGRLPDRIVQQIADSITMLPAPE